MDYLDLEAERLKLDPQEARVCLKCDRCNAEIYEGQNYYVFERDCLCEQCFDENADLKGFYFTRSGTFFKNKRDAKISMQVKNYEEISGHGLYGKIDGKDVLFGNEKLLEKYDVAYEKLVKDAIYLVVDGEIEGYVTLKEEVRDGLESLRKNMKKHGIEEVIMLTGDNEKSAEKIAKQIGISQFYAGLLPNEKLNKVRELKTKGKVIFIGDGINDSPVLAGSNFGIAMGEGTEIASSTADAILISNKISSLPQIIEVAKKTMNVVKFNVAFSLLVKMIVLVLAVIGIAPMWLAVVADTGVSLLTVLNSIRILRG